ncbi:MAG: GLPGLI family protein [Saprospiraceae bacterium]|nr:GLPGLI family protein [Saprospiraceae bacterium]
MPQTHSVQKVLYFQGGESLYKNNLGNQDLEVNNNDQHGGEIRMVMKSPENTLYADVKNNVMINSQEFFGKLFLINGENKKQLWKITGEQKTLLDYTCVKAMLQDTTNTVAWFTTKLPANMGPNGFTGLPGMIMMVDIDNGSAFM